MLFIRLMDESNKLRGKMSVTVNEKLLFLIKTNVNDHWTRTFCESLQQQVDGGKTLSDRQEQILNEKYIQYGPEAQKENSTWVEEWDAGKEECFRVCALYYKRTGYYSSIVSNVDERGNLALGYTPTKREFQKLCNNKYAIKILNAWFDDPKYPVGSIVAIRATAPSRNGGQIYAKHKNNKTITYFVVESNSNTPTSSCAGAKKYKIIGAGSSDLIEIEERHLKKIRKR